MKKHVSEAISPIANIRNRIRDIRNEMWEYAVKYRFDPFHDEAYSHCLEKMNKLLKEIENVE